MTKLYGHWFDDENAYWACQNAPLWMGSCLGIHDGQHTSLCGRRLLHILSSDEDCDACERLRIMQELSS